MTLVQDGTTNAAAAPAPADAAPAAPAAGTLDPAHAAGKATAPGAAPVVAPVLDADQLRSFHTDGYLVIRNAFDEATLTRFETAARSHPPLDQVVVGQTYPGPGRWTLARNAMADPDLAFIMAEPAMTEPMRAVLGDDPKIIMFAYYDRTPGGAGLPSHNDYKRWRPIGSSMRWAFAIVPLCDFDESAGKLEFAPGSHRVAHSPDPYAPVWNAERPSQPSEDQFIDPELHRGDLAIVDMHTWHRAGKNNAAHHRTGLFTKWCAATQPPATGWFPYNDEVRQALGPDGEHVLGFSSPLPISATAALLERVRPDGNEVLFLERDGVLHLPTGPAVKEGSIPDWDEGNFIGGLSDALASTVKTRPAWMSYVGDYADGGELSRVYAYRIPPHAWGVHTKGAVWLTAAALAERRGELAQPWAADAVAEWQRDDLIRGKAVSEATGRADQYSC